MKKNQTKEENKLEQSITSYFERAEFATDTNPSADHSIFEKEKVYANVLESIGQQHKKTFLSRTISIAASLFILISVAIAAYYIHKSDQPEAMAMLQQFAPRGKVIKLSLADGTTVFLNAGSSLSYPKSFSNKTRLVSLKGEGFFNVAHDHQRPFIIQTEKLNTQVLGTSFNINAYPEHEDIKVTVVSGKVAVYEQNRNQKEFTQFITPNQQVVYNKEKQELSKIEKTVNAKDLVAWSAGQMIYTNQTLSEVITAVERQYNVDIEAQPNLKTCRVTANFDNASLKKVLLVLSKLVDGEVEFKKGIYYLKGKGCQ